MALIQKSYVLVIETLQLNSRTVTQHYQLMDIRDGWMDGWMGNGHAEAFAADLWLK